MAKKKNGSGLKVAEGTQQEKKPEPDKPKQAEQVVTNCPQCNHPLVNVGRHSLCPEGCGGLKPPLPPSVNRKNTALMQGTLSLAWRVAFLRLANPPVAPPDGGIPAKLGDRYVWSIKGEPTLYFRIPVCPKRDRDEFDRECINEATGNKVLLRPLWDEPELILALYAPPGAKGYIGAKRRGDDNDSRRKGIPQSGVLSVADLVERMQMIGLMGSAIEATISKVTKERAVKLGLREPEPDDEQEKSTAAGNTDGQANGAAESAGAVAEP